MKLLLDTNALIWATSAPEKLTEAAKNAIIDRRNTVIIPVVALWEIQIKSSLGKLEINKPLPEIIEDQQANGMMILPVMPTHVFRLGSLPDIHRDPFDRLLVAQAFVEGLTIVSADGLLKDYDVPLLW